MDSYKHLFYSFVGTACAKVIVVRSNDCYLNPERVWV